MDNREIDKLIVEKVMGFIRMTIQPDWYALPVDLFFAPESVWVIYSYDENGCNALMFRNGNDASDGYARPLPAYSEDIEYTLEVVEKMQEQGWSFSLERAAINRQWCTIFTLGVTDREIENYADTAPMSICLAALQAIGVEIESNV